MKPFGSKALFLHRNHNLHRPSVFLNVYHFSASPGGNSHYGAPRRQEEDSRNVRVSVWWDFENCGIPAGVNEFKVSHAITSAVRTNGMKGPIQITAFGDVSKLARNRQEALTSSGINIVHIPNGGKNSAVRSLLVDLLYWISQNPPPAHLFLISGDRDFAGILHRLRMSNYNILLASRENAPAVLCSAASIMWHWSSLVKGEDLHGKLYNQPPDGPYNSWYGHYKRPVVDPFAIDEPQQQQVVPKAKGEVCVEPKTTPVPRTVTRQVLSIMSSHPKGIPIGELEVELKKHPFSKDYCGHRTISQFLVAMPLIAKLQLQSDGTYMVHPVTAKSSGPLELDINGSAEHVESREVEDSDDLKVQVGGEGEHDSGDRNQKTSSESLKELIPEGNSGKVEVIASADQNVKRCHVNVQEVPQHDKPKAENLDTQMREVQDPKPEPGFVRRVWKRWFGPSDDVSSRECDKSLEQIPASASENCASSEDLADKGTNKGKVSFDANASNLKVLAPPSDESANIEQASAGSDKSSKNTSLVQRVVKWCKFWRVDNEPEVSSERSDGTDKDQISHSVRDMIFSKDTFWSEMKSFLDSPTGSIVFQSRTRAEMAQKLHKAGPESLKTLTENDLLHLVDLLITERKLVEEHFSLPFPFKLAGATSSKGLTSIFSSKQNIPHAGASKKKGTERPRDQILADCKRFLNVIATEYPGGYNIGLFRRGFLQKYGYPLDIQMLGYQKVSDLVQIFPGATTMSGHIVPSGSKGILSAVPDAAEEVKVDPNVIAVKEDDLNSPWEELGPVSNSLKNKDYYEAVVVDDEFSDSEDERMEQRKRHRKQSDVVLDKEDNSLLHILGQWDAIKNGSRGSRQQQPKKVYSFVTDQKQSQKRVLTATGESKITA